MVAHSWRTKIARAEHHLDDFKSRIAPSQERRTYPVRERFEPDYEDGCYVGRIVIPEPEDPLLPLIAGDLMFNLRSALDHLATALVPEAKRTRRTAFPMFTIDPNERDPSTGNYLHKRARRRWGEVTKGIPESAMAIVERAQAYKLRLLGLDPRYGALALLHTFQNADKHSRLMFVVGGLHDPTIWHAVSPATKRRVRLPRLPPDRRLPPNAIVRLGDEPLPPEMNMEAEGTVDVMLGDGRNGAYMSCPYIFEAMISDTTRVAADLEAFASHLPTARGSGTL
jgi:hypothetical protein